MNDNHDQMEPSMQTGGSGADWKTTWAPSRRHFLTFTGLALGGAALGLGAAACGTAQTGSQRRQRQAKGRAGAAGETLFVAGFQWGPPTSFNPLAASPAWPTAEWPEPADLREPAALQPARRLARSPVWPRSCRSPTTSTCVLPLQDGTKWSDGSELTADDVVFTFELGKKDGLVTSPTSGSYLDSVDGHRSAHRASSS